MPRTAARLSVWPLAAYAALALATLALPARRDAVSEREGVPDRRVAGSRADAAAEHRITPRSAVSAARDNRWWTVLRDAALQWIAHKDARLGAALAYYSVFSMGPLILIAVAIAGLLFGHEAVSRQVSDTLHDMLGPTGSQAVQAMLAGASKPTHGIIAGAIGVGTLIFAAVGVVVQLKDALNTIWDVEPAQQSGGIWSFVRSYILSLAGVLALGFLLLVSMLVTTALAAAGKLLAPRLPEAALQSVNFIVSFAVITGLFAAMFKWFPDIEVQWRDVWVGAALTAALFTVGKMLIGLYIGKQGLESTYGAAASIVIVLIWVYYSAQIVLYGAEVTNVMSKRRAHS
jgi:membrane protein